jgi:hypothetical protein
VFTRGNDPRVFTRGNMVVGLMNVIDHLDSVSCLFWNFGCYGEYEYIGRARL